MQSVTLSFNNLEDVVLLPVGITAFEMTYPSINTTVNVTAIGDVNLIGKTGLATINIASFFPKQDYPFCQSNNAKAPYEYVQMIQKWRTSGRPIRLTIAGTEINMAMSIENFTICERDGTGDVYFSLDLKEYIFIKTDTKAHKITTNGTVLNVPTAKRDTKSIPKTYAVKKGDTLYTIAKKLTGNGANYKAIAKTNKIKDPNKIYIGQKLVI